MRIRLPKSSPFAASANSRIPNNALSRSNFIRLCTCRIRLSEIEVRWRSGARSVVEDARPNYLYEIDEAGAQVVQSERPALKGKSADNPAALTNHPTPLFRDVSDLIKHTHIEEPFNDFDRQPLLSRKLSQLGPGVSWYDVDGDGWDDLIIGSGKGGQLAVYRNDG